LTRVGLLLTEQSPCHMSGIICSEIRGISEGVQEGRTNQMQRLAELEQPVALPPADFIRAIGIFRQNGAHLTNLGAGESGNRCVWRTAVGFWIRSSA